MNFKKNDLSKDNFYNCPEETKWQKHFTVGISFFANVKY